MSNLDCGTVPSSVAKVKVPGSMVPQMKPSFIIDCKHPSPVLATLVRRLDGKSKETRVFKCFSGLAPRHSFLSQETIADVLMMSDPLVLIEGISLYMVFDRDSV